MSADSAIQTPPAEVRPVSRAEISAPTVVLYHAHCADGFGAALVAWMVFGETATYEAVSCQAPLPEIPDGARVFIVDFSYPRAVLEQLAERCFVQVLDHHKTAEEELRGLAIARFEEEKSGAVMAWEFFRDFAPDVIFGAVPKLLLYIQDRDLWRWELEASREVNAGLWARPRTFSEWAQLVGYGAAGIAHLASEGRVVLRVNEAMIASLVPRARWVRWLAPGMDYFVPVINTPVLQSEVCHALLETHREAPWCAAYFDQDGGDPGSIERVWSLRSRGEVDVSAIAKQHGGGGHHNAAGYTELLYPETTKP